MNNYYFKIEKAILKVRADDLEDAREELEGFMTEFEDVEYNDTPIEIEKCDF